MNARQLMNNFAAACDRIEPGYWMPNTFAEIERFTMEGRHVCTEGTVHDEVCGICGVTRRNPTSDGNLSVFPR